MKIGIIQTRGLGDIVIAAPIAMYYIERGCEVYWPIDSDFLKPFSYAFPKIKFIGVDKKITGSNTADFFYNTPLKLLNDIECKQIICLYSYLTGFNFGNEKIANCISFDSYKYAVSNVPFIEKWNLNIKRNPIEESNLFDRINLLPSENYIVIHDQGSVHTADFSAIIPNGVKTIIIKPITENVLDWLGVIEHAQSVYVVNSVYSNLIDQMNFKMEKFLHANTEPKWTPIFLNKWTYI
jgi:hypothetical protein